MSAQAWQNIALGIGVDTAQGAPSDALEYTAAAGGAGYIIGSAKKVLLF